MPSVCFPVAVHISWFGQGTVCGVSQIGVNSQAEDFYRGTLRFCTAHHQPCSELKSAWLCGDQRLGVLILADRSVATDDQFGFSGPDVLSELWWSTSSGRGAERSGLDRPLVERGWFSGLSPGDGSGSSSSTALYDQCLGAKVNWMRALNFLYFPPKSG